MQKARLFDQVKQELNQHMDAEEKYFYSALEQNGNRQAALTAREQHKAAKALIGQIDMDEKDQ